MRRDLSQMTDLAADGAQGGGASGQATGGQGQQGAQSTAQQIFGGQDGAAGGQTSGTGGAGQQDGQQQGQQGGQAASGQSGPPPNVIPMETLEQVVKTLAQQNQVQQQQQQQPQMTQEEFDKMFNVFKLPADFLTQLRHEDPVVATGALTTMIQGIVRQAATLSAFHTTQELQKLQGQLSPALEFVQTQQMDRLKNEFFEAYPNLKGLEPLLLQIRDSLIKEGKNFKSKEDAFKAVAERAQEILSKIPGYTGGNTTNNAGGQQQQASGQQQTRRMPSLSGQGQGGGAGGGKGSAGPKSTAERIFGPR